MQSGSIENHYSGCFRIWLGFLLLSMLVISCEDQPVDRAYPRVRTLEVTGITEEGAIFKGDVYDLGESPITEHGFAWSYYKPDINESDRIFLGPFDDTGTFKVEIFTTLKTDVTYRVRAFVVAGEYTVYGEEVSFTSLGSSGPVITGFNPKTVEYGDTVVVTGRNFSWVSNSTFIGDIQTPNIAVADTVLKLKVLKSITNWENFISVEIAGNRTTYTADKLFINFPIIASISPQLAYWGDTLTIDIENLKSYDFSSISLNNIIAYPVEAYDGSKVRIVVPATLEPSEAVVAVGIPGFKTISQSSFILLPPVIDSISPLCGDLSSTVSLYGHFSPDLTGTSVKFGDLAATILSLTKDSVKVQVPSSLPAASYLVYMYGSFQCISPQQYSIYPPEITSVSPMSDYAGGIVTITGKNFNPNSTSVRFNDISSKIISVTINEVKCYVPGGYNGNAVITFSSGGEEIVYPEPFVMTNPVVTSFYPAEGTIGDTITMICKDYIPGTGFVLSPTMGTTGVALTIVSAVNNTIKAVIKNYSTVSGYLGATISRNSISSIISNEQVFKLENSPEITSIYPISGTVGTEVTITGSNFSAVAQYNNVIINGKSATITYSDRNEIRFIVPPITFSGEYAVTVYVGNIYVISTEKFSYTNTWSRLPDLPFTCGYDFAMKFDNEVIIAHGISTSKSLYRFDQISGTLTNLNDQTYTFPSVWPAAVVKADKAYLFGFSNGQSLFYTFDYGSLTIEKVSDYPGAPYGDQILLDGDTVLYMGGGYTVGPGYNREFWKYSLLSGRWTRLNDLPGNSCHTNEFTVNGRNFVVFNTTYTSEYDPANDSWIPRAHYIGYWCRFRVDVECGGKVYMGYGDYSGESAIYRYDPETDVWFSLGNLGPPRQSYYLNFSLDDKVFIGGGYGASAMYKFDPDYGQ
jgi:hypothetical protein